MVERAPLELRLARYMREHGLKHTRQREVIFDHLVRATSHLSVEELLGSVQQDLPGVGYATVYRTLKMLAAAGVAAERRFGDGQARYEAHDARDHHDHLICRTCGHIFEFEDNLIEDRQQGIAADHGLRIVSHHHEIFGECEAPEACEHRKAMAASGQG